MSLTYTQLLSKNKSNYENKSGRLCVFLVMSDLLRRYRLYLKESDFF